MPNRPSSNPLYASEEQVAEMVLGPGRVRDWKERIVVLEREGLPEIDPLMGGRYLPAVKTFFDKRSEMINQRRNLRRAPPDEKDLANCSRRKLTPPTRPASSGVNEPTNVSPIGSPPAKR
jgi:hypothetical protein